jgi:Tfp pilus assembly protein PilF
VHIARFFLVVAATFLLGACSSAPVRDLGLDKYAPRKAEQELSYGIRSYEDGNYKTAARSLQLALDMGLTFQSDQISAHKYLAFIHCVSDREKQCRDEFKKALDLDPTFDLSTSEAGHPIWGPVFRGLKAEQPPPRKK